MDYYKESLRLHYEWKGKLETKARAKAVLGLLTQHLIISAWIWSIMSLTLAPPSTLSSVKSMPESDFIASSRSVI